MAHTLVPSNHVETASLYGRDDKKIGTIERLMLEKRSGTVAYVVVRDAADYSKVRYGTIQCLGTR